MLGAGPSAELAVFPSGIVPHHEVGLVPVSCIVVDISVVHCIKVVFDLNVEQSILVFSRCSSIAPRVPQQEQFLAVLLNLVEYDVRVV